MVALKRFLCPVDLSELSIDALACGSSIAVDRARVAARAGEPGQVIGNDAAAFAVDLANRSSASVRLLHVIEWLPEDDARETSQSAQAQFPPYRMIAEREDLAALIARLPQVEKGITADVTAGHAHRQISRVATEMKADLIVLGAHGRGALAAAPLGQTTQHVVRAADCPVLTVRRSRGHMSEQEGRHVSGL